MIRLDDIEVYLRITLPTLKKSRTLNRLVCAIGWLPLSRGKQIWMGSRETMSKVANQVATEDE
jgi:hypothetical protein